jgi:hypothetical protein
MRISSHVDDGAPPLRSVERKNFSILICLLFIAVRNAEKNPEGGKGNKGESETRPSGGGD